MRLCSIRRSCLLALLPLAALATGCEEEPPFFQTTYAFCISPPESVSFGAQTIRTVETRSVVVTNCGNVMVEDIEVAIEEEGPTAAGREAFTLLRTRVPKPLLPGARFNLPLRFRPTEVGTYAADLVVSVPSEGVGKVAAAVLSGEGVPPTSCDLLLGPDPLAFGTVLLQGSADAEVQLTNQGTGPCVLSGARVIDGHDDFEVSDAPPASVAAGATATLRVTFSPAEEGERTGILSIVEGGGAEYQLDLTGLGQTTDACVLRANPPTLVAPRASVGFLSTTASGTITNIGVLPCTVSTVAVSAGAEDFSVSAGPGAGDVLEPGDEVAIDVAFSPTAPGERTGEIEVTPAEGAPLAIEVRGFADPTPSCALLFTPGPIAFDPVGVGLPAVREVTFENLSDRTCAVSGVRVEGGAASEFEVLSVDVADELAPGDEGRATVRFLPRIPAPATDRLLVDFGDGTSFGADLLGFGAEADLVLTPFVIPVETVTDGCVSRTYGFELQNLGPVAARVDDVRFTPVSDPNFEVLSAPAAGTLVQPFTTSLIEVRMASGPAPGRHAGALEVMATGAREERVRGSVFGGTASVEDSLVTDVFTQRERPAADILFVIDDSGSMGDEQDNLSANFAAFIGFTSQLQIDYHLGVVTTDMTDPAKAGAFVAPYIQNTGIYVTPNPEQAFSAMAQVGTTGSGTEQGLQAAVAALSAPRASQGDNAGFLRDSAILSVVIVSDENDYSPDSVAQYVERLVALKGGDSRAVVLSAIAGDVPGGCSANGNSASAAPRYLEAVQAFEGAFASICTSDWASTLEDIGFETFDALRRFTLSRLPEDGGALQVVIDGVPIPSSDANGWSYDPVSNTITFNGDAVPESGEVVEVTYQAECIAP